MTVRRAFVALGSNLGDRWAHLASGRDALPDVVACSPVYETEPVGGPGGQGAYLNAVVELRTERSPRELLALAHRAEAAADRVRVERWGPRTLDVDVLLVGDLIVDDEDLVVPHPRMWERGFVLVPLADLAPDLVVGRLDARHRAGIELAGTLDAVARPHEPTADVTPEAVTTKSVTPESVAPESVNPESVAPESVAVVTGRQELGELLGERRRAGATVGLVPTMGALHAGHLSLIRRAAADCDLVVVSVYVNPLQFAPTDDLAAYPRDLEADCALAASAGAHAVFAPTGAEMWPEPSATTVRVAGVSASLEGASRPGHFDGVATIVAKLFGLAGPCVAYFGEKDFQQLAVVRRMAADLSLPVTVVGCPIVRDPDGLALSSRNAYLSAEERAIAPRLYWALLAGRRIIEDERRRDPEAVVAAMAESVAAVPELTLDYAAVVDPETLTTPDSLDGEVRLLVAARLGRARLIDNLAATVPEPVAT